MYEQAYFTHRSKCHAEGSLEAIVQKLVKNWEVESHHISDIKHWKTMDVEKFQAFSNGEGPVSAQTMCDVGPYNMLLGNMHDYQAAKESFESANDVFRETCESLRALKKLSLDGIDGNCVNP